VKYEPLTGDEYIEALFAEDSPFVHVSPLQTAPPSSQYPRLAADVDVGEIITFPDGSVGCVKPVDLPALLLIQGERHGFPSLRLPFHDERLPAGESAWKVFADTAEIGLIAESLLVLDDAPPLSPGRFEKTK
jgi:hypothetical protein